MSPQIDYNALAKQYGAIGSSPPPAKPKTTEEYTALAKQYGAIGSTTATGPPSDYLSKTEDFINDVSNGLWKGAGQLPSLISRGLNKLPYVGETLAPSQGVKAFQQIVRTTNIGETVGAGLEQAVEMALTGGPLRAGATALATKLPAFLRFLAPALRVGAEAINTGGNAALHDQPVGPSAAMGAGGAAVSEGLPLVAPWVKKMALAQYERALGPTKGTMKNTVQKIAPEMISRGVSGSLESIEKQAAAQSVPLKAPLNAAYDALPAASTAGSGTKIINDLETLKGRYIVDGIPSQPAAVNAIEGVQDIIRQHGPDISPTSLRKLKQIFDDPVAAKGGYSGADLAGKYALRAQEAAANSIRGILHQASPDIAALDKEITLWLNVQKVAKQSALRRTGQEGGLLKVLGPLATGGAGGVGYATGGLHGGLEGMLGTLAAAKLAETLRSPAWRTMSAVQKSRIADALASGAAGDLARIFGRAGTAGYGQTNAQANQNTIPLSQ